MDCYSLFFFFFFFGGGGEGGGGTKGRRIGPVKLTRNLVGLENKDW